MAISQAMVQSITCNTKSTLIQYPGHAHLALDSPRSSESPEHSSEVSLGL